MEHDHFIDPVEELRIKRPFELIHDVVFHLAKGVCLIFPLEANRRILLNRRGHSGSTS